MTVALVPAPAASPMISVLQIRTLSYDNAMERVEKRVRHRRPATLPSPEMGRPRKPKSEKAVSVGLRFPPELLARIDAEVERMTRETGIQLSRAQVVMHLLRLGLEARARPRSDKQ